MGSEPPSPSPSSKLSSPEPSSSYIWSQTPRELIDRLQTDLIRGIDEDVAKQRLIDHGLNELPARPPNFLKIYLAPLFNWLIVIYLGAAMVMFVFGLITGEGNMTMIIITLGVVGLNAVVAIIQQARATKKLRALRELAAPTTRVIRGGHQQEILTKNVVAGDLLVLETGDRIPADARIIKASNLQVNEASLTGESEPVRKIAQELEDRPLHLQNQENILFLGTYITMGRGTAVVYVTGARTEIGKISLGLEQSQDKEIPIQQKLNNIGKWFGVGIMVAWLITLAIIYFVFDSIEFIESLNSAMDMMPINIPLLTTIVMLTGTLTMAEHGVIVRNLTSVDSLGRVSVVCTDKTGTLTKSQMCVQHIWVRGSHFTVSGTGYSPQGDIYLADNPDHPVLVDHVNPTEKFPHLHLLLTNCHLNNTAHVVKHEFEVGSRVLSDWKVIGNPTEGALRTLVHKLNSHQPGFEEQFQDYALLHEFPFDSGVKRMTQLYRTPNDRYMVLTKGASEVLISACTHLLAEENTSVELADEMRMIIMNSINEYAVQGYRILSFACKLLDNLPSELSQFRTQYQKQVQKTQVQTQVQTHGVPDSQEVRDNVEANLTYVGFVAIMDPPREGVSQAITQCHQAGVNVVMITGDSLPTAKAIAGQIGITTAETKNICEGHNLEELAECGDIQDVSVFARVSPTHKQTIIDTYHKNGKIVAMTGDGVNDALALNDADVGIAMGIQGTDVAKEAADMIISDDSFLSIVEGIKRGRGIFANIRSVVFFFVCINVFEGLVQFLLAIILDKPYFLDEAYYFQWIFLSLTVHMFPGLMLTFDRISPDVMQEYPRDSQEIISKPILGLMLLYGLFLAGAMVVIYFLVQSGLYANENNTDFGRWNSFYLFTQETLHLWEGLIFRTAKTLTMLMTTLFLCETALALQIRRPNKSLWKSLVEDRSPLIYLVVGGLFSIYLAILYIPGLQLWLTAQGIAFNFVRLNFADWGLCVGISLCICILPFEAVKALCRRKNIRF
ncbi:MAG: cation-translocating P-type ATPase [Promethearchaeota archaeon]